MAVPPIIANQRFGAGGRYQLLEFLGHGHFGEVWKATDHHQHQRPVAVKLFKQQVRFDQVVNEAKLQTLSREHPNVVEVFNVDLAPPRPLIAMEYLERGSAEARLRAGRVTLVEAVRWTRNALDGLHHVHQEGVLHRDIKPGNFLLRPNGTAAVSDFGLAEDTVLKTVQGMYLPHAAPELLTGAPSSVASDIWAMGCSLYRLLTSRHPFDSREAAASGRYEDAQQLNPQLPRSLTRVISRALDLNPGRRYPSAAAMVSELAACGVRANWILVDDPSAAAAWSMALEDRDLLLRLVSRRRGGFELTVSADLRRGAGARRFRLERFDTEGRARQRMRTVLAAGVMGQI
jgi:serine/threonine-protein kinase